MNKKISLILVFFILIGTTTIAGGIILPPPVDNPSLIAEWYPIWDQTPERVGPATFIYFKVKTTCNNGPCDNVTATIQCCEGDGCTNYVDMPYPSGSCGNSGILQTYTETIQDLGSFSGDKYPKWTLHINFPGAQGHIFNLRIITKGSFIDTNYLSGMQLEMDNYPGITLNSPSTSETTEVSIGGQLSINWTTTDLDNDNILSRIYYYPVGNPGNTQMIYQSPWQAPGTHSTNWTIPDVDTGNYYLYVNANDNYTSTNSKNATININPAPSTLSALILSPSDLNNFFIGSTINFKSNIKCGNSPCTVKWDSNKDSEWYSTDENFSYSGLSIGDHNITLTVTDSISETATDSVNIKINPITADVLSISDFEIIKVEPNNRFAVNGKIRIKAKVNYYQSQSISGKAFIIISDSITHKAIYGPEPFYFSFTIPSFEEYDLNIDLSNYPFVERQNYKVEFLAVSNQVESSGEYFVNPVDSDSAYWDDGDSYYIPDEQIPEQNKANNSGYQIIELGPANLGDISQLPETNPAIILLILFSVLIIIKKK